MLSATQQRNAVLMFAWIGKETAFPFVEQDYSIVKG